MQAADAVQICYGCGLFDTLQTVAGEYAAAIYVKLARAALPTARLIAAFSLFGFILKIFLDPSKGGQLWPEFMKEAGWIAIAAILLNLGGPNTLFSFVRDPLEATALNLAEVMIEGSAATMAPARFPDDGAKQGQPVPAGTYAWLWSGAERSVFGIISKLTASPNAVQTSWLGALVDGLIQFFAQLIVIVPYLFLLFFLAAQIVQVMFAFILVSAVSPLLVLFLASNVTRRLPFAALKLLFTYALSIVFSAVALGFTIQIIDHYANVIGQGIQQHDLVFMGREYLAMIVLGVVSFLMHQMAPRLAAQLGGGAGTRLTPSQHWADRYRRMIGGRMARNLAGAAFALPVRSTGAAGLRLARDAAYRTGTMLINRFGDKH